MKEGDRQEFATVITALAATFRKEADSAMIQGYWMGLQDIPIDAVLSACAEAIRSLRYFPLPVEIRSLAGVGSPAKKAALLWAEVSKAAKRADWPDDPTAAEVVRHMGGPKRLGMMPEDEFETWGRKEFERIFVAVVEAEDVRRRLKAPDNTRSLSGAAAEIAGVLAEKKSIP